MASDPFLETSFLPCLPDGALQRRGIKVMAKLLTAARVYGAPGGRKEVLPEQFARGVGVFYSQSIGKGNFAIASRQVFFVKEADAFHLATQGRDDGFGQRHNAILFAFPIPNGDGFIFKIHILDAQADTFHQAQARAIEQLSHEPICALKMVQQTEHLLARQNGREAFGTFGRRKENGFDLLVKDFPIQEENRTQGLILGRGGDVSFLRQVGEEGADFGRAHLGRMAFPMKKDKAAHPIHIGLFRAVRRLLEAQGFTELIEKFLCHPEFWMKKMV